jgi:hypothetical protein
MTDLPNFLQIRNIKFGRQTHFQSIRKKKIAKIREKRSTLVVFYRKVLYFFSKKQLFWLFIFYDCSVAKVLFYIDMYKKSCFFEKFKDILVIDRFPPFFFTIFLTLT